MIYIDEDKMGNIVLSSDLDDKEVFFQFESDTSAVKEMLTENEVADLESGWTVEVDDEEPRASVFSEYFELDME